MSLLKRLEKTQPPPEPTTKLEELRLKRQPTAPVREPSMDIKRSIQERLIAELDPNLDITANAAEVRQTIDGLFGSVLAQQNIVLSRTERTRLFEQIVSEILGYGPIEPLLADPTVTEIMVNGPRLVYVERKGRLEKTSVVFDDNDHLMRVIDRIVSPLGRRVDESSPLVDARLPDGSHVNAVIEPIALKGASLTIRKFAATPLTIEDLINYGSLSAEAVELLRACVMARLNIVISGGTGSGKTTLLNVLSGFIPSDERIVTIENAAELQLRQEHVVTLESRPPNIEGRGEIGIRDLVVNSLRMRPDRIVVGEVRSGEALDMLQAMNTGHDGSLTTAHSNSPRDTLARLETMCLMAGMDLPLRAIREQMASALDLIVHQERMRDGTRKVTNITEVQGMESDVIVLSDIFQFEQTGVEDGKIIGRLKPTGIRPKFMDKLEASGIKLAPDIFGVSFRFRSARCAAAVLSAGEGMVMSLTMLVPLLAGSSVFLVLFGLSRINKNATIEERLDRYASREVEMLEQRKKGKEVPESGFAGRLNRAISGRKGSNEIQAQLARADLKIKVSEYVMVNVASVFLFATLGWAAFHQSLLLAAAGAVVGFYAPRFYVSGRQKARLAAFDGQLSDAINQIVNALRSGYSLIQSMESVSKELAPPISVEFARVVQEVGLGLAMETAMNNMLRRIQSDDLDMMITAINIQHEVGGNLAEVLDTIAHTIRERVRIKGEIRVLTAQQMYTAYLISFLPLGLGLVLYMINRSYISLLFSEVCGWIMVVVAVIIVTIGYIVIRKIVAIEV